MPYGEIKFDTATFTSDGVDKSITVSGIVASISGNLTATGTVSGNIIIGATVTGNTGQFTAVTGGNAQFTSVTGGAAGFTAITGTTVTGNIAQFTTITGGTAGFTTVTGTTVTGSSARFTTITGGTAGFTTVTGTTVTGGTGQFTTITGNTAAFTTVTGTTVTGTAANFSSGTFANYSTASGFIPTGSGIPTNGMYLPSGNTVGIAASGIPSTRITNSGYFENASGVVSGVFYPVVTQTDIGTAPNQVPVCGMLGDLAFTNFPFWRGGSNTSTTSGVVTIDGALYDRFNYTASIATGVTVNFSNLTNGREVKLYIRNTNATARPINFAASSSDTGHTAVNLAPGNPPGSASVSGITLSGSTGTAMVWVGNIDGSIVGGLF